MRFKSLSSPIRMPDGTVETDPVTPYGPTINFLSENIVSIKFALKCRFEMSRVTPRVFLKKLMHSCTYWVVRERGSLIVVQRCSFRIFSIFMIVCFAISTLFFVG